MSNLQIYTEQKQQLSEVAFIKDTLKQTQIKKINNSYEATKQLTIWITHSALTSGIKNEVEEVFEKDIKELILMRFKGLSVDELYYAFKLERFKVLGEKTEHFQSFNADYVSTVLDKYIAYKRQIKSVHNISATAPKKELFSETEIKRLTSNAIRKTLQHFLAHLSIPKDYVFIYDELYAKGFLNQSVEFKKSVHKDAIELLEQELKERKPASKEEHHEIRKQIQSLTKPKQSIVISKCKELSIVDFFRKLRKDEKQMEAFKEVYEITEN